MTRKSIRSRFWQRPVAFWNSAITLATWRWRTQWFLLLTTGVGITIAVVLVASLPLFSHMLTTASLRNVLRARPDSSQIVASTALHGISSDLVADSSARVDRLVHQDIGKYLLAPPQTTLVTGNWYLNHDGFKLNFYGVPIQTAQVHLQLLQGRLPVDKADDANIEIMLTRTVALYLGHLQVGDDIPLSTVLFTGPLSQYGIDPQVIPYVKSITAHVVGIFQVDANDAYWNGSTLETLPPLSRMVPPPYLALTSQSALLTLLDSIAQQHQANGIYFADKTINSVYLSYNLNTSVIASSELEKLIAQLGKLQQDTYKLFFLVTGSNISAVNVYGPTLHGLNSDSSLEKFQSQVEILRTPSLLLTALILCLVLYFISTMVNALVTRDQASIAVLRSRGAKRRQIFASLLTQGLALCLFAAILGPLLALALVYLVVPHLLTTSTQDAINAFALDPGPVLRSLSIYTLIAVAITFLTLLGSLFLAVRANILTQRREQARALRTPLWQRLRLDLGIALLAIVGYVLTIYLQKTQSLLDAQSQTLASAPLQLLPPLLLLLAGILFFLRFFPHLLRLLVRLTQHRQNLTSTLAFVQMERSPQQPMRMALLLGLAIAFAFFSLIFSASQEQRALDITNYQAVSDFSGYSTSLPISSSPGDAATVLSSTTTRYREISGVISATVGYIDRRYLPVGNGSQQLYMRKATLNAVDADTFARTAIWNPQNSSQPLGELMDLLRSQRTQAFQRGVVPAIVATSTWELLNLTPGTIFYLADDAGDPDATPYVALAEVSHIPPVDDAVQGAVLVDYQSLVAGRAQQRKTTQPNYIWLRTSDNPLAVKHVRAALNDPTVALDDLVDRYAINGTNASDPLANHLLTLLSMGVIAALLLAFLANLLLPLLNVQARQTHFAVLRALGTTPRQITRILTWEMATTLTAALLLGLLFGTLLAFSSVPPLIFTSVLPTNLVDISSTAVFTSQAIIPVTIVLPPSLLLALVVLLALCVVSLVLMTRLAQRPLMAELLLLDDDG